MKEECDVWKEECVCVGRGKGTGGPFVPAGVDMSHVVVTSVTRANHKAVTGRRRVLTVALAQCLEFQ